MQKNLYGCGHLVGSSHPQPGLFAHLMPARFINIHACLLPEIALGFFYRLLQGLTGFLFLGRNASQTHLGMKANFHQLCHIPMAHPKPSTQITDHRLGARPETAFWHIFRPLATRLSTAHQAGQSMPLIFGDDGFRFGQLTHRMPLGLRVFSQQQCSTLLASVRFAHHQTLNLFRRFQFATMSMMPLLSTRLSTRGFCIGSGWRLRSIR